MRGLPVRWRTVHLADVVDVLDSRRIPVNAKDRATRIGDVPYYGATGQVGQIDEALFDEELVLLGEDGAPFLDGSKSKAYLIRGPAWVNNHAHVLRATGATSNRYLLHALNTVDYRPFVNGTTRLKLTQAAMRQISLPLPPLAVQERIVALIEEQFSRLDGGEHLLRSARRRAELMRSAVSAAVTPADGKWTTLGQIAGIVGGVTKDSKRQQEPSFVEVPYLRVANVQRGYLDLSDVATIKVPPDKAKALRLEPGDVLFNEGGDRDKLGRGWLWQGEIDDCIHQNHVFRARLITEEFDSKYVSFHGNSFGQQWFEQMGKQTTNLASINMRTLKAFPIPNLPIDEQRRIVAEVERQLTLIDSLTSAIDHALIRSGNLRRSILERAFSGDLVPQDPGDEPASQPLADARPDREAGSPSRRRRKRA